MTPFSRPILAAWLLLALNLSLPVAAAPFGRSSSLIQKRSVSISVLKASSAVTNGCTPDQITAINTAITEGKQLATTASLALVNPKIRTSTNFKNWMGASNNPSTINAEHFLPISTNLNEASTQVDNLDNLGQDDLTYVCPPESACGSGKAGEVTASTRNFKADKPATDVTNRNLIQFCPVFFGTGSTSSQAGNQPQSLAEATTKINAGVPFNVVPSMAIVHEVQHSIPIVGALARVTDLKVIDPRSKTKALVKAYSLRICRDVLTDAQKITNAQSFAWFAFFAHASPDLNTDDCNAPATAPSTSGTKTPPATPAKIPRFSLSIRKLQDILGRAPIKIPASIVEDGAEDAEKGLGSVIGKFNPFSKGDPVPAKAPVTPPKVPTQPKEIPPKETAATKVTETAAATETATEATATKTTAAETSSTSTASKSTASASETLTSAASSSTLATTTSSASSSSSASSTSSSSSTSASSTPSACAIQNKTFDSLTSFVDEDEDADGDLAD